MKKYIIALLFSTICLNAAFADELPDAPEDELQASIKTCTDWATEDNVVAEELKLHVLNCVNDDLTNMGYKNVTKID